LSTEERAEAPVLQKQLATIRQQVLDLKVCNPQTLVEIENRAITELTGRGWKPDYIAIRQQRNLAKPSQVDLDAKQPLVIVTAAKLGKTRLIDNLEI
ncbi:MAG: pantoate--beta-alanine ligase, partial [Polynucleobacter sp.]|nr:pantoate--beta-alanine ligase [Polynucleobacter sp.]